MLVYKSGGRVLQKEYGDGTVLESDEHYTSGFAIFEMVVWRQVSEAISTGSLSFFTSTSFKSLQEAKTYAASMREFRRVYSPEIS